MASDVPSKETALRELHEALRSMRATAFWSSPGHVKLLDRVQAAAKALVSQPSEPPQGEAEPVVALVKRLRATPNWMRESYGHWKDCTLIYDRAPFEAADLLEAMVAHPPQGKADAVEAVFIKKTGAYAGSRWKLRVTFDGKCVAEAIDIPGLLHIFALDQLEEAA